MTIFYFPDGFLPRYTPAEIYVVTPTRAACRILEHALSANNTLEKRTTSEKCFSRGSSLVALCVYKEVGNGSISLACHSAANADVPGYGGACIISRFSVRVLSSILLAHIETGRISSKIVIETRSRCRWTRLDLVYLGENEI